MRQGPLALPCLCDVLSCGSSALAFLAHLHTPRYVVLPTGSTRCTLPSGLSQTPVGQLRPPSLWLSTALNGIALLSYYTLSGSSNDLFLALHALLSPPIRFGGVRPVCAVAGAHALDMLVELDILLACYVQSGGEFCGGTSGR